MDNFLPRTGIEQLFMRHNMQFNRSHKEFDPIYDTTYVKNQIDEYKLKEANRNYQSSKIVYDCMDTNSPFYPNGDFLNPQDQL